MRLRHDARPLYLQAEEALSRLIQEGRLRQGEHLPPEPELARQMGISRATLREALRAFEDKGLITRRRGLGTFVNAPAHQIDSGLEQLESVDTIAHRIGMICTTEDLEIHEQPADRDTAIQLDVPQGSTVITVGYTKVTDGTVVAYMCDALPGWVTDAAALRTNFKSSVLDFLLEKRVPLAFASTNILATRADPAVAGRLRVKPSTVLLQMEEVTHTQDNRIAAYSKNYFLPNFFKFHLLRRVAPSR